MFSFSSIPSHIFSFITHKDHNQHLRDTGGMANRARNLIFHRFLRNCCHNSVQTVYGWQQSLVHTECCSGWQFEFETVYQTVSASRFLFGNSQFHLQRSGSTGCILVVAGAGRIATDRRDTVAWHRTDPAEVAVVEVRRRCFWSWLKSWRNHFVDNHKENCWRLSAEEKKKKVYIHFTWANITWAIDHENCTLFPSSKGFVMFFWTFVFFTCLRAMLNEQVASVASPNFR